MGVKNILSEIEKDIADVAGTKFDYTNTKFVPSTNDSGLSYERGTNKRGKILKTCVLYVDIRESVALTSKHHSITMGRIYTSFTKAIIKVARHHSGHTRNIIGDRVMIVFPEERCFTNAVECAISINHIAKKIFPSKFPGVDFKCGIGIDFGELKILKVGIQRNGTESAENKGLVWTGYPANVASRLTDMGNKTVNDLRYIVKYYPINMSWKVGANVPLYFPTPRLDNISEEQFAKAIHVHTTGEMFYVGGKMITFERKMESFTFKPILITQAVLTGYKAEAPSFDPSFWSEQTHQIKNVSGKVFGGDIHWLI